LRERIDHEVALLDPRFQAVDLPPKVHELVRARIGSIAVAAAPRTDPTGAATMAPIVALPSAPPLIAGPPGKIGDAVKGYIEFVRNDNAALYAANKLSILRRLLGSKRMEKIFGPGQGAPTAGPWPSPFLRSSKASTCTS
jgi:hypothetical protein